MGWQSVPAYAMGRVALRIYASVPTESSADGDATISMVESPMARP